MDESRSPIRKISGLLSRLRRIFRLIRQSSPLWTTIAIIVVFIQGLIPLASVYLLKLIVDTATSAATGGNGEDLLGRSLLLVMAVCILAFVRILCNSIETFVRDAQMAVLRDRMLGLMHRKSHEADFSHFENSEYLDGLYRTQEEIGFRPLNILEGLLDIARNGIALLAVAGLVVSFHWLFAFLLIASCVPSAHARSKYGKILYDWYMERTQRERLAFHLHWMFCAGTYAKEIRSYLLGSLFERRYQDIKKVLRDERLDIIKRRGIAEFFGSLVPTLTFYMTYAFVVYQTILGRLTIGDMVMFYQAFHLTQEYVQTIMMRVAKLYEDDLFLSSFYDVMDAQTETTDSPDCVDFPCPIKKGLTYSNVGFAYPGSENCAIESVSLTAKPGAIVGIVGENGSGKTTLIKLLCRLYEPTTGVISIDGIPLNRLRIHDLRKELSVAFQDYSQYPFSAEENIGFWDGDGRSDIGRVEDAARLSGADPVIKRLPEGYGTKLSRWFQDGKELSAGEWQKVILARALYKKSQILVLDEPTSLLDTRSEIQFFTELRKPAQDGIIIVVSHRLHTLEMVDYIYLMDHGRIVESGTPDEMAHSDTYSRLFGLAPNEDSA